MKDPHKQPTCFGCGADNPHGLRAEFEGDAAQMRGTMLMTEHLVGAPGRMHGGIVMAFLDEGLGLLCQETAGGLDAMTARLSVNLRSPAFVGDVLDQRAWVELAEGRKIFVRGEVRSGDRLVADAEGLWIVPRAA